VTDQVRDFWNAEAATFDDEPDHGLLDPAVRAAWADLLVPVLPPAPADVIDLGSGTGTLAVLLAQNDYLVRGLDLSERMVAAARAKAAAADVPIDFRPGDAAEPPLAPASADVVLARHVLFMLPDPTAALERWIGLLRPGGRLVLVEGRWSTGAGLTGSECASLVGNVRKDVSVTRLDDPALWGHPIDDERYLLVSRS
jgi:SAM-dependent methyltransferase